MADDRKKPFTPNFNWAPSVPSLKPDPYAIAKQAYHSGNVDLAERQCRTILSQHPGNTRAKELLGLIAGVTERPELAVELLTEVTSLDPKSWDSFNALSIILRQQGKLEEAIRFRSEANKLRPSDPNGVNEIGLSYLELKQFPEAEAHFRRAISLRSYAAPFHHNLGHALQMQGKITESIASYQESIRLEPRSPVAYASLAKLLASVGRVEESLEYSQRAYEVDPHSIGGNLEMANAFIELGRFADAESFIRKALEFDQDNPDANCLMASWLHQRGHFELAEVYIQKAIRLRPTWSAPYLLLTSGRKMRESDRELLQGLSRRLSDSPEYFDLPGDVHFAVAKGLDDLREYEMALDHFHAGNRIAFERKSKITPFDSEGYEKGTDLSIQTFTHDFFESNRRLGNESNRPVLIVGMIRSGTTLVEQILTSHPEIASGGELPYWTSLGNESQIKLSDEQVFTEVSQIATNYLQVLANIDLDAPRVTDKMPQNYFALGLIHTAFPNARIIHCRRNPIDTCLSIYFTYLWTAPDFAHNPENIVFVYHQYQRLMDHWRKVLPPDRFTEVDYEEIVTDREPIVRRLLDFMGLEWNEACLHHDQNDRFIRTPSMWQARQPVYRTSTDRWRNYEPWLGSFRALLET